MIGRTARLWLFVALLSAAAAGVYMAGLRGLSAPGGLGIPWWCLAGLFFLSEAYPVHLYLRSEAHSLSLSEVPLVLAFFALSPSWLLLAILCGAGPALILRRQRPLKLAFNLAQFAFSAAVAALVFRAVLGSHGAHGPIGWLGAGAAAAAFAGTSVALVSATISMASGNSAVGGLPKVATIALVGSVAASSLAVAAVVLLQANPLAIWLLLVPGASCTLAFRAYTAQRRRHEHLEFLYQAMRAMQSAPEFRVAVRELLVAARAMLSAEFAEVILFSPTAADGALRSVLGPEGVRHLESAELTDVELRALDAASGQEGALLLPRGRRPHVLDAYLGELGLADAMLTALRRDDRIFGLLVVGERSGDVSTFNTDDRRLFETFASHAGVLLENDRVKEQLRYQAFHDGLTGLPNRALFTERVADSLRRAAPGETLPTVLFLDLDDFKTINDTLGHSAGDELLASVAERVRECVRPTDTAARLGGDEFGILLEAAHVGDAERVAGRLVEALRPPFVLFGREMLVHASVGIASAAQQTVTADELLSNADVAMYSAKAGGKRRYAHYEPHMHTRVRRRHELAGALEHAVGRGEIGVHYQPIVALATGRTVALEALARWRHPSRGLVLPASFIPLAEETGLMVPIGRAVLREACEQAAAWRSRFPRHAQLSISVNLSPSELQNPQLAREIETVLSQTGVPPESLILEITESSAMRDPDATLETLGGLSRLGVRLALDDFGTGYSSLSHLRDFPIDIVKLAKPFVDRLDIGPSDSTFTDAILRLAGALDLDVVAEGIERREQSETLRSFECALGQGYYFARPLDAAAAEAHLGARGPVRARLGIQAA